MSNQETDAYVRFKNYLSHSLAQKTLVKLALGNYQGEDETLKQIYVKLIVVKRQEKLSFTYRHKTKDIVKNYSIEAGIAKILQFISSDFKIGTLFTSLKEIIFEHHKNGKKVLRERGLSDQLAVELTHDRKKPRLIKPEKNTYLHALKVTDSTGNVYKNAQNKYKQINQYIEILSSLIKEFPEGSIKHVADMGAGKGYLTFALYDYLHQQKMNVDITGVEFRKDLVDICNTIAEESGFKQLDFVQGTIDSYPVTAIDLLIALHACDTATDDVIAKGIRANASLIVVAPCCHKQIRKEMERNNVNNEVSFLTKYGIFLERQAEMVTDGIRALVLNYFGYKTKVFEFISDQHTPKNVMIVGVKLTTENAADDNMQKRQREILTKINETQTYFGIDYHHLLRLMQLQ